MGKADGFTHPPILEAKAARIQFATGIDEDKLQEALEPFARIEESRNRESGGAGLGLAIARAVALAHGGDLILSRRSEGGLSARILLPRPEPAEMT